MKTGDQQPTGDCLPDSAMFWKSVDASDSTEPKRRRFDKTVIGSRRLIRRVKLHGE